MSDEQLFAFESDFVASLRCIPMAVRMKLDCVAIKLTLRQWSRFTRDDRQQLLVTPCRTPQQIEAFRHLLVDLIAMRAGEVATPLSDPPIALWKARDRVPDAVRRYADSVDAPSPNQETWARLTELQRFALLKLTRDNHDNVNFVPALREFGVL